jgi:hypothetical protein
MKLITTFPLERYDISAFGLRARRREHPGLAKATTIVADRFVGKVAVARRLCGERQRSVVTLGGPSRLLSNRLIWVERRPASIVATADDDLARPPSSVVARARLPRYLALSYVDYPLAKIGARDGVGLR